MPSIFRETSTANLDCAACASPWDMDYLFTLFRRGRLRAHGFAHVALPDGGLAINHCPRCDRAPAPKYKEFPQWTSLAPLF